MSLKNLTAFLASSVMGQHEFTPFNLTVLVLFHIANSSVLKHGCPSQVMSRALVPTSEEDDPELPVVELPDEHGRGRQQNDR
ncbi:hypothetical protein ACFXTH_010605 [Malus domestica]